MTTLLKRKLQKAETLYQFKWYRNFNRGYRMSGLDMDLIAESAAKYKITTSQLQAYLLTGVVK